VITARERSPRVAVVCLLLGFCLFTTAVAQSPNRAALVITLEEGQLITRCVEFSEDELTGYELLNRSRLAVEASVTGSGVTVCNIEGSGCPVDDCFCKCKGGPDCLYWSYWHVDEDEWRYSQAGAAIYPVTDGAIDGWVWGIGSPNEAPAPPAITFDQICMPESPAAQPVEQPPASAASGQSLGASNTPDETTGLAATGGAEGREVGHQGPGEQSTGKRPFAFALFALLAAAGALLLRNRVRREGRS